MHANIKAGGFHRLDYASGLAEHIALVRADTTSDYCFEHKYIGTIVLLTTLTSDFEFETV